jgi:3-oxoacyl-[acyl-carrier-protein] synthase II
VIDLSSVVVTGFGTVNAAGCGRQETAAAFRDSRLPWTEIAPPPHGGRTNRAELAGLTAAFDLSPWLSPRAARRMSLPSKLAVAATRMALDEAGPEILEQMKTSPTAVMASNAYGPSAWVEKFFGQSLSEGPMAASPALFTETVANAPAAQVAMTFGATGPNVTVTQREAGALIAFLRGATEIALGRVRCALVVAVDELTPLLHAILDRFHALAHSGADGRELARPFARGRNGFIAAEGATALVLEPEAVVRRDGRRVLARVASATSAFDPGGHRSAWSQDPRNLSAALQRYFETAGHRVEEIDGIVSGASGATAGDALEGRVLKAVWGPRPLPPILAPKATLGEHGGATLAAAILALDGASFGSVVGFSEADPELGIIPNEGWPQEPKKVLVTGLATGGAAAWAVLEGANYE